MPEASHDARPHVAHFILGLGMGGDAKNCVSLAREQAKWARVSIATIDATGGPRAAQVPNGVSLAPGMHDPAALMAWIAASGVDVVLFHRAGVTNPVETPFARAIAERIGVFEYNTFGRFDPETEGVWSGQLQLCRSTLLQHAARRGTESLARRDQLAAGYAVDELPAIDPAERAAARARFGIAPDAMVAVRLMRPDLRKWEGTPVLATKRALDRGARVHLVVREAPVERVAWARRQLGERATLLSATSDAARIRETLAAGDCIVNYSTIGETFGLALAEGMACGLPALVNSTPEADNAQIELCEHGVTGFVANGVRAVADALVRLDAQREERERMGREARRRIVDWFAAPVVERRVRRFLIDRLRETNHPEWSKLVDPGAIHDGYAIDDAWLTARAEAERASLRVASPSVADVVDDAHLRALRLLDGARYARRIGPRQVARVLASRLKRGSLKRG